MALFKTIDISPFDNIEGKLSGLTPYTHIRFLPGTHLVNSLNADKSIISIQKSNIGVELMAGALLKVNDNILSLDTVGELIQNQSLTIDTFEYRGTFSGTSQTDIWIKIDSATTFQWESRAGTGVPTYPDHNLITITGDWQTLENGIDIRITQTTGHTVGGIAILAFGTEENYGIKVGSGFHVDTIENVNIFGKGMLDMNMRGNVKPSFHHKNQRSAVLMWGRIFYSTVRDITMKDQHRSFCCYGDNDGTYNFGGSVTGGESFNMFDISVLNTRTISNFSQYGAGIELGHPEHRGWSYQVKCNGNFVDCMSQPIEPNFQLNQYQVYNNYLKTIDKDSGVHCWRKSENGMIIGNSLFGDTTDKAVVLESSPSGWDDPVNLYKDNNFNLQSVIGN